MQPTFLWEGGEEEREPIDARDGLTMSDLGCSFCLDAFSGPVSLIRIHQQRVVHSQISENSSHFELRCFSERHQQKLEYSLPLPPNLPSRTRHYNESFADVVFLPAVMAEAICHERGKGEKNGTCEFGSRSKKPYFVPPRLSAKRRRRRRRRIPFSQGNFGGGRARSILQRGGGKIPLTLFSSSPHGGRTEFTVCF